MQSEKIFCSKMPGIYKIPEGLGLTESLVDVKIGSSGLVRHSALSSRVSLR